MQKTIARADQVHVAGEGLDDDRRNAVALGTEGFFELLGVVVVEHQGVLGEVLGHAAGGRVAEGQQTRAGLDQQAVGVAVVAAFKLDDGVAAGEATRQADGAHRRFGAGADQTHHVQAGQMCAQLLGNLHFRLGRRAEGQAFERRLAHRLDDGRMRMAGNGRPPGADIVDIRCTVSVPHARALGTRNETRKAADRAKGTHRRIDAAGDHSLGAIEQGFVSTHEFFQINCS